METKSIVKLYGNIISVAFPLCMYTLNVGKVSVALAYANAEVLSLLHKMEQVFSILLKCTHNSECPLQTEY